jgi:hypothetical protein
MKEQLLKQKEDIEGEMFYEQMKDYMDWDYYYGLQAQLKEVNQKLEALNWGSFFIALVSTLWVRVLICCAGKQKKCKRLHIDTAVQIKL